ncbi:MAG: recombinase family protein [Streptosporangiaceae bacterium]
MISATGIVSGDGQTTDNQVPDVERFCAHHGYTITRTYSISDSAWKQGPEYRKAVQQALDDAQQGHFTIVIIWALDRIVRSGSEAGKSASEEALSLFRQFGQRHVSIVSVKEPWLTGSPEIQAVLISFAAWVAEQESRRRSERVRAGMERARREGTRSGKPIGGRRPGAKDTKPRSKAGYAAEQARRKAAARG